MGDDGRRNQNIRNCFRTITAKEMAAETLGTFVYVTFGLSAWASYVLSDALVGLWQVGAIWAFGCAVGMLIAFHTSGGHLNPVVSLAFAIFRRKEFPWWKVITYMLAQLLGAFLAGCLIFAIYYDAFKQFELGAGWSRTKVTRGGLGSEISAMVLCNYFPNPKVYHVQNWGQDTPEQLMNQPSNYYKYYGKVVRPGGAFGIELACTALFVFIFFALTDRKNRFINRTFPGHWLQPLIIGATVGVLIAGFGPLTMVGINPARDFGPRMVAVITGWFKIAIPGPRNGFWVYLVGPLAGALVGAALYEFVMHLALPSRKDLREKYGDEYDFDEGGTFVLKRKGTGSDEAVLVRQRR